MDKNELLLRRAINKAEHKKFELFSTCKQKKIRDSVEDMAKQKGIPPSEMEAILTEEGEIKEDWYI